MLYQKIEILNSQKIWKKKNVKMYKYIMDIINQTRN